MIVHEDIVKGQTSLSLSSGWTASRVFIVTDVDGTPDSVAYRAISSGQIPAPGTLHPSIPKIVVDNISGNPLGSRQVELTLTYKAINSSNSSPDEESQTQINISGTIKTVKTNYHINEKGEEELMKLSYIYPTNKDPNGIDGAVNKVIPMIEKQIPMIVATLSRRESKDPAQKAFDFVGKLNSRTFIGGKRELWMCTKISGSSGDSGETFSVTYEFMRNEGGWNTDVLFTDERTGKPPVDIEKQKETAIINVKTQRTADFNKLKLGPFSKA